MGQKAQARVDGSSDFDDTFDRTRTAFRTKGPTVLVAARFATIRRLLAIVLDCGGYEVLEADQRGEVGRSAGADVALVVIDADHDGSDQSHLTWLEESGISPDVPVIVLADEQSAGAKGRLVINMPRASTVESILLMVQALTLGRARKGPSRIA